MTHNATSFATSRSTCSAEPQRTIGTQPPTFWVIEAVASDGEINERRRELLLSWASEQRIPEGVCKFLSGFVSRHDAVARRRLKDLATNTFAWYADEPTREIALVRRGR